MATFNGPALIAAPPLPPRPYGIFDVALGPMPFPEAPAVGGGVQYIPDTCQDDIYLYDMTCPPVSGSKTFNTVEDAVTANPFAVITTYTCGSLGFTFAEVEQRVRNRMSLREQRAVERRIWSGQALGGLGGIPGLFQSATSLGAAGCPVEAMELLEQALADNGVVGGIIHTRPAMSPHLVNNHQIVEQGRLRRTSVGTPVVFGQGYDGTGPAGQAVTTTTEYMYASGRILIWQDSEVAVPPIGQTMNRGTNQMFATAERVYAVAIECGVWAVQVTRTCTTAGGGT